MVNLDKCISYEEYISTAKEEEILFIDELYKQGRLVSHGVEDIKNIKNIKSNINILVITDTFCKDSATTIPFLMKLSELNSKIHVNFLKKEGKEELLQELSGECRIPTIIKLDEKKQMKGKYIEFPQVVREKINGKNEEERNAIVEEVRSGKYNDEIQKEIIKLILK